MSAEQKHTPTPWRVDPEQDIDIQSADGKTEIAITLCDQLANVSMRFRGSMPSKSKAKANTALIVRAVNCHDDMLAALQLAEDVLSRAPASTRIWPNGMHPNDGVERIRAAIAKATGAQS
jgi:hypothetical protein